MELKEFFAKVEETWPFDEENYPALKGLDEEGRRLYILNHINLHVGKSNGVISDFLEWCGHGRDMNNHHTLRLIHQIHEVVRKQMINFARMAAVLGYTPEQFKKDFEAEIMRENVYKRARSLSESMASPFPPTDDDIPF
ncbi:MAG: hypothetical protein KBC48_02990 [Candidatus Pacebacteria bacterium]|nr:hypothetical protein [Candidatus Paceibacterota bacterium]